jgi:hypothetical protein
MYFGHVETVVRTCQVNLRNARIAHARRHGPRREPFLLTKLRHQLGYVESRFLVHCLDFSPSSFPGLLFHVVHFE